MSASAKMRPGRDGGPTLDAAPRVGNWMQTIGGRAFYPLDPRPEDIDVGDIAHALAFLCRFGGHCREFYSVAEHSVRVSQAIESAAGGTREDALYGLLHDAAEAYVGDMVWPLKQAAEVIGYRAIEHRVELAIATHFGLPSKQPGIVKHFDLVLLATEKRDLMGLNEDPTRHGAKREHDAAQKDQQLGDWHCASYEPLPEKIVPLSPVAARRIFLSRFDYLRLPSEKKAR